MWNPVPFVDIVVEYLAGTRVNNNGHAPPRRWAESLNIDHR